MKKILILEPHSDQAQAIAKYIKCYSKEISVIGGLTGSDSQYDSIPFFDMLEKIPSDFRVNTDKYDMVLPTGAKSTKEFMKLNNQIQIGKITFNQENIQVFNKISMLKLIRELNIPIPETYSSVDEINKFPVFYKQRFETGGGSRGIIQDKKELDTLSRDKSIFFQEFIDSPITYGIGFLARDGNLITSFIQKELYSYPKPGGSGVILQTFDDEKLLEYTQRILKKLHYNGWGLIEFKYCPKRKDYVFMEVNAKFWASIEFALLNNPVFFQELFNIYYSSPKKVNCIIFLDRLAQYGVKEYFSLIISNMNCYKLHFGRSVFILIINSIPTKLKAMIKYVIQ